MMIADSCCGVLFDPVCFSTPGKSLVDDEHFLELVDQNSAAWQVSIRSLKKKRTVEKTSRLTNNKNSLIKQLSSLLKIINC